MSESEDDDLMITCVKNVERSRKQFQLQTESDDSDFESVVEDFKQLSPDKKRAKTDNALLEKSRVVKRLDFGEEEEAVSGDIIQHFNGNKNCLLFSSCAPTYSTEEIVSILICSEEDKVCTERPIACRRNASFVLDTSCLDHRDDYKADDNGSFRHQGKKVEHVELDDEGDVVKLDSKPDISKEGQYRLLRTYWVHKSNPQFKRRVIELEDSSGNLSPLVMLQYIFDGDPESITVKPHGRAKKNQRPFFTTASGTRTKISEKATSSMGPSSIYDHLYLEAGDVMSRKSSSDVPRSVDQVKYERKNCAVNMRKISWLN